MKLGSSHSAYVLLVVVGILQSSGTPRILGQDKPLQVSKKLVEEGRVVEAAAILDRFLKEHPESADGWLERARLFDKTPAGTEQAFQAANRCLKLAPRHVAALEFRGLLEVERQHWKEAEADFNTALEVDASRGDLFAFRGLCRSRQQQFESALVDYAKAIDLAPTDDGVWNLRGQTHLTLKSWDKALADFGQAIRLNPTNGDYRLNRGDLLLEQGEDRKAVADYSVAIETNPKDGYAWHQRAVAYYRASHWEYSFRDADHAVLLQPGNVDSLCVRGAAAAKLGRSQPAIDDLTAALREQSDHPASLLQRGMVYSELSRWSLAEADFRRLSEVDPKLAEAWSQLAVVSFRQLKFEEAISSAARAIELEGDNATFHRNRAAVLAEMGRWKEASEEFTKCIALETSTVDNLREAALVAVACKEEKRLTEIANQSRTQFASNTNEEDLLNRATIALLGKTDDELRSLLPQLFADPAPMVISDRKKLIGGLMHLRLREVDRARTLFESLAPLDPAEKAAAEGATGMALALNANPNDAKKLIEVARKRLVEMRIPTEPPEKGYRMTWQSRVFAEWILSCAEASL